MSVSSEELSELSEKKPQLSTESILELQELLERFPSSPRYVITAGLQVAQFLTSSPFPPDSLKEMTLRELSENGVLLLAYADGVTNEHIHDLSEVLKALIESSEELIDHPGRGEPLAPPEDIPLYSSIEAERMIEEGLSELKKSKKFESLKEVKLEKHWNLPEITALTIPAAPFLESLTYGEIVQIPASTLLKKRSVTLRKIHHLISLLKFHTSSEKSKKAKRGFIPGFLADKLIRLLQKYSSKE